MRNKNHHWGRSVDQVLKDKLKDKSFREAYVRARAELELAHAMRTIMAQRKISIRALARRMNSSVSQVQRLMDDRIKSFNVDTLVRFAAATGRKLHIEFSH